MEATVRATCAKPELSVGAQLKRTFSGLTVVPLTVIFFIYLTCAILSGKNVITASTSSLEDTVKTTMIDAARMSGEVIQKKLENLEGVVELIEQAMLDRVQGYSPSNTAAQRAELWRDANVPFAFENVASGAATRAYPLATPAAYLDIAAGAMGGASGAAAVEALGVSGVAAAGASGARWDYQTTSATGASVALFKGSCEVGATAAEAPWDYYYVAGCDAAANAPNAEQAVLLNKTAHLDLFLKPLYEAYGDIHGLGVYFYAGGDGATRFYPGLFPVPSGCYVPCVADADALTCASVAPGLSDDDCTAANADCVCGRDYNPAERAWFWDALRADGEILHSGPYPTAFYPSGDGYSDTMWVISLTKGVRDRDTGAIIGVISLDIEISGMQALIDEVTLGETGTASLARWGTGDVVAAATCWDPSTATETTTVAACDNGLGEGDWASLSHHDEATSGQTLLHVGETYVSRAFIPSVGEPKYVIVLTLDEKEIFDDIDQMAADIARDVDSAILTTFFITLGVTLLVTALVFAMAKNLTTPLKFMTRVANRIIGNAAGDLGAGVSAIPDFGREDEVGELVFQFGTMIRGLGGKSSAAAVAHEGVAEQLDNAKYVHAKPFSSRAGGARARPALGAKNSFYDHATAAIGY